MEAAQCDDCTGGRAAQTKQGQLTGRAWTGLTGRWARVIGGRGTPAGISRCF